MEWKHEVDRFAERTLNESVAISDNNWLTKAIEQKNARLSIAIAYSELLVYDQLDRKIVSSIICN
jgi:hypothetical protein